jgi:hypothetical protein
MNLIGREPALDILRGLPRFEAIARRIIPPEFSRVGQNSMPLRK